MLDMSFKKKVLVENMLDYVLYQLNSWIYLARARITTCRVFNGANLFNASIYTFNKEQHRVMHYIYVTLFHLLIGLNKDCYEITK